MTGPAADASLVPAALRAELPAPRRATLADLEAWSYGPFRAKDRVVEVTVAPTTSGVLAVTCSAPPASWRAALDCADGVHAITSAKAQALARGYDALAVAARRGNRPRFIAARAAIARADTALAGALLRLRR